MEKRPQLHDSQLFTVRLWQEIVDADHTEWRGKVQHVLSGEVRYFRDWTMLISFLLDTLKKQDRDEHPDSTIEYS